MSSYPSSEGVVVFEETKSRLAGASITAKPIEEANVVAVASMAFLTNDDGVFTIPEADKPWMIEILHKDIEPMAVRWEPDGTRKEFIVLTANRNRRPGQFFFIGLALTLCALILLYLCLHYNVKKAGGPLSNLLIQKITTGQNLHATNGQIEFELARQIRAANVEKVFSSDTVANELGKALARGNVDSVYTCLLYTSRCV